MQMNRSRRRAAYAAIALGFTALTASTPGQAIIPTDVVAAVETAQDQAPGTPAPVDASDAKTDLFKYLGDGVASYYGRELAGNRTASGERFDPAAMTAAHRTLPLGSRVRVTNKSNGKSVIVRINDRGPFRKGRLIDVSLAAAREISMVGAGMASVQLDLIS